MARSPLELLQRAKVLVPEKADFFRLLIDWYSKYKVTKQILHELSQLAGECWISLDVNDQPFVKNFHVDSAGVQELAWIIPPDLLRKKSNEITVTVERDSSAELLVASASLADSPQSGRQTLDLSVKNPRPLANFWMPAFSGARQRQQLHGWSITRSGSMTFAFAVADAVPVHFILNAALACDASFSLDDLLDEIMKAIERREQELRKKLDNVDKIQAENLEIDLSDLRAYKKLHYDEIEPAFGGRAKRADFSKQSGKSTPKRHDVRPTAKPTVVQPVGGFFAGLGKLLVILIVLGIGGGLCYSAWRNGELKIPFLDELTRNRDQDRLNRDLADRLQASGAKTGEVQISLGWFNKNDLDLHVVAPSGEVVSYARRQSQCGGKLDVDMNVNYATASDRAVENVYWSSAPKGRYQVFVNHFTKHTQPDCNDPTNFAVRVVNHGATRVYTGEVVNADAVRRRVLVAEFDVN